jgi:hypothetical protein
MYLTQGLTFHINDSTIEKICGVKLDGVGNSRYYVTSNSTIYTIH